jgi:hypothetical protein
VIKSRYGYVDDQQQTEISFNNKEEKNILEAFCSYVQDEDPDILVFEGDHYPSTILDYLFSRMTNTQKKSVIG